MRAQLDNVLLSRQPDGTLAVKLCDFGYSKELVAWSGCKTRCGTPEYVAPEVNPQLTPAFPWFLRRCCCRSASGMAAKSPSVAAGSRSDQRKP